MKRRVGALMFDGFEMLDLYGPLEMYAMHPQAFQSVAVAQHDTPIHASNGPATLPETTFDRGETFDILLIPGGPGARQQVDNPALLQWLAQQAQTAELVTSVCTGAALLACAGVLDGHRATTNKQAFDWVAGLEPKADWQTRARWVESGRLITASGVSAGIDMTLAVIERLLGPEAANAAAHDAEYIRNQDPADDPFAI